VLDPHSLLAPLAGGGDFSHHGVGNRSPRGARLAQKPQDIRAGQGPQTLLDKATGSHIVPMPVLDQNRQAVDLQATVDTGFSGFLSLPLAQINALQLPYDRTEIFTIGSSGDIEFDLYSGTVLWDGQERDVFVLATDCDPLIGMSLIQGYHLFVAVVDGGEVHIEVRP
jgi:clan AA aspartic protease